MATSILGLKNDYVDGDNIDGSDLDDAADSIEWAAAGYKAYDAAGSGSSTLGASDYESSVLVLSGVLTGTRTLVLPLSAGRRWLVWNNTSGAYSLTLIGASGTGVVITQGYLRWVWTNGTNVYAGPEWSGATDNVLRVASALILAGTGAATCKPGGMLAASSTAVGNITTGEDDLISSTIPAAVLGTNLDSLEIIAWGTFAATANNKRVKLKYGATTLFDTGVLAINGDSWFLRAFVVRTGAATQIAIACITTGDALMLASASYTTPTETLSGTVIVKCTGEAVDTDDIIQKGLLVRWNPSA